MATGTETRVRLIMMWDIGTSAVICNIRDERAIALRNPMP